VLRVTSEHPDARLQSAIMPDSARASCAQSRPIPIYATNASLRLDGRASLPPCRGTSRGRMRGVGATCTAPTTHGRPKRMKAQEYGKIRAARNQRCRYLSFPLSFPSERRLSPRSDRSLGVLPADRRDWLAACEPMHRHSRSRRRGALSAGRVTGMEPSGRAAGLGGSHHSLGNGGCCKVGEPAGALFGATARNDPHEYESRPLRETARGSSRAVVWGSPPVETEGGTGRASFFGETPLGHPPVSERTRCV
jgi:hypothetical protein